MILGREKALIDVGRWGDIMKVHCSRGRDDLHSTHNNSGTAVTSLHVFLYIRKEQYTE